MALLSQVVRSVETSLAAVDAVPIGLHTFALAGLIGGIILWMLGGKLLRPAFALVGIAAGAALGGVLVPALGPATIFGFQSLHVGMVVGAIVGMSLTLTLFRFAMGIAGALVFAVLGVLATGIWLSGTPGALPVDLPNVISDSAARDQALGELKQDLSDAAKHLQDGVSVTDLAKSDDAAARTKAVAGELQAQVTDLWSRTPEDSKLKLTGGAFGGALLGLLIGLVMPKKSAALFTSFLGAASLLASGTWLVHAANLPGRELLHRGPVAWLAIWVVFGIIGLAVQTARGKKSAPKPAANDAKG